MLSSLIECFLDSAVRNLYELPSGYLKVLSQGYLAAYESKAVKTFEEVPKGVSLDDNFIIFCAESVLDFPGFYPVWGVQVAGNGKVSCRK